MTVPVDVSNWLSALLSQTPITGTGGSDELNRAYMAANAQRYAAGIQAASQLATQDQANRIRYAELMGADASNSPTDAATRWRQELAAQQQVQDAKLRQEFAQLMGYAVDANGNITSTPTLQSRQLANEIQQAALNRQQQAQLAREQQQFQGQESYAERSIRQAMQQREIESQYGLAREQQGFQRGESAAERALRQQMQQAELGSTAQQNQLERDLRERLQKGQLTQQESEFARSYILQQEASRRQQAELGGYMLNTQGQSTGQLTEAARAARAGEAMRGAELSGYLASGQLTEAGRAAREQERTQRAALAAQLMQSPKDVFRAGAYFRNLAGSDPYAMGLDGGGIAGFNTMAQRAQGTPGSATLADVDAMPGVSSGTNAQEFQALMAPGPQQQAQAATGMPEQTSTGGGVSAAQTLGGSTNSGSAPDDQRDASPIPGLGPGGPVGDPLTDLINGRRGMGAGGNFQGRAAPDGSVPGVVPYVDPQVLLDPAVQAMVQDVRDQGVNDDQNERRGSRGRKGGRARKGTMSGPAGPQGEALLYDAQEADRRRWADERFLQGLAGLNRRGVLGRPGSGPAGPVDAPLWPEGGYGAAMPQVQTPQSVGGSSFDLGAAAAPATPPGFSAAAPSSGLTGMDAGNHQAAMNYLSDYLVNGVGNSDPQLWEKLSKTQRGLLEGALQAAGLNMDDYLQAYSQSRFQNVGNILSA